MSEQRVFNLRRFGIGLFAFLLWVVSALLGLLDIVVLREMALRVYSRFVGDGTVYRADYWGGVALGQTVLSRAAAISCNVARRSTISRALDSQSTPSNRNTSGC